MIAYKLFRLRKNGSLGPLFIHKRLSIAAGEWLEAESHPTKGYAHRKGWHCCKVPHAPHLSENGRVWCEIEIDDYQELKRPESQGGSWYLAQRMKVIKQL